MELVVTALRLTLLLAHLVKSSLRGAPMSSMENWSTLWTAGTNDELRTTVQSSTKKMQCDLNTRSLKWYLVPIIQIATEVRSNGITWELVTMKSDPIDFGSWLVLSCSLIFLNEGMYKQRPSCIGHNKTQFETLLMSLSQSLQQTMADRNKPWNVDSSAAKALYRIYIISCV